MADTKTVHGDWLRASHRSLTTGETLGVGFTSSDAVQAAAALFDQVPMDNRGPWRERPVPRAFTLELSPGAVRLRYANVDGWEARPEAFDRPNDVAADVAIAKAHDLLDHHFSIEDDREPIDIPEDMPGPESLRSGRIVGWSKDSRRRMIYRLATLDWAPVIDGPGSTRPAMVTLTYPGDWTAVAPTAAAAKRHLQRFRQAWDRQMPYEARGPWKMEFQARGAPHFHLYLACPVGKVAVRMGKGRGSYEVTMTFQEWVSRTWARIVDAKGEDGRKHLRAGTGVDFAEGSRCSDPKRLAIYFSRHNAKGGKDKAYQHRPPDEWGDTGRWWGVWRMDPAAETVSLDRAHYVEARRLLRRWTRAQGRTTTNYRTVAVDETSGAVRRRRQNRRVTGAWLGHRSMSGGWSLMNDAPAFAAQLARHLSTIEAPCASP